MYGEEEKWIKSLNTDIYPHLNLKYKEYGRMTDLCRTINRKILPVKMVPSHSTIQWNIGELTLTLPLLIK